MRIQLFVIGCSRCKALAEQTQKAIDELELSISIEKVTDINDFVKYGATVTPALAIDGKVQVAGRVPTVDEIKKLLERAYQQVS